NNMANKIKAIDLFSGCGGVSCGLTNMKFAVKAAVEIDESATETYRNYPPLGRVNLLQQDICELNGAEILRAAGIEQDELYLLAGCPPCQNFSMKNRENRGKTESERKKLLFEYLRIIEEIHPPFVLMENVPGIKANLNKNILDEFIGRLNNEGGQDNERYMVISQVLNAADYGVPQLRKRFVLHAVRYDIYLEMQEYGIEFTLPFPTHDKDQRNNLLPWVTVREAIGDLPAIAAGDAYPNNGTIFNHRCAALNDKNLRRMRHIRANGGSRTSLPDDLVLECHKKKNKDGNAFSGHKDVYGIMDGDKPSPTMTGGCLFYTKGRYGHYDQDRAISIREAARLQTFPDDFIFSDILGKAALQIGNAVPIKLVEVSAVEIKKAILTIKRERKKKENA
ncbi:MAG: DNA cytosine methyltransferase, partial [Firmicutes bacterium]|nr:DNA cytosine methyltransferase [Bacillota bacterium]